MDITIEKTINGYLRLMTIKNNQLIQYVYIGYNKKQALKEFRYYLKTLKLTT